MWLPLQGQILRSLPLKGHIMCSRTWKSLNTLFGISLCVITVCLLEKSTVLGIGRMRDSSPKLQQQQYLIGYLCVWLNRQLFE